MIVLFARPLIDALPISKSSPPALRETDLYPPVKAFLEGQGYEVKAEIGAADIYGRRGQEDPVIVELKTGFTLPLLHQALDRLAVTDLVYLAVPNKPGRAAYKARLANTKLCRRLGVGLLSVRLADGFVEAHCDPGPYAPRKSKRRQTALLREFERRKGDPNKGGSTGRTIITAYRQSAESCADYLAEHGATKASIVAKATDVENARAIMADNHYGWFERVERGVYGLSDVGLTAANRHNRSVEKPGGL